VRSKQIRFAVGEPGDQLSPVWKIWNQKNDVYLTGKFTGSAFKISLHASGVWTVAATSESGIEVQPGNRRMETWHRPTEFEKGWTWGPHIAVPRMAQVDHAKIDEAQSKDIEWIPKPPENTRATIAVIFAAPEKTLQDVAEISDAGDAYIEAYLELQNLEKMFIRIRNEPLSETDHTNIDYLQSLAEPWIAANDDVRGFLAMFMRAGEVPCVYVLKWATPST
jgi:hypothetical protein